MIETYRGLLKVYFGDRHNKVGMDDIEQARYCDAFKTIVDEMSLDKLMVLTQEHGIQGFVVDKNVKEDVSLFQHQGDFLVTNLKNCGLAVLTADCLPVILFDPVKLAVGIVHAGWRGSSQGVVSETLKTMQKQYNSLLPDIEVLFGASAGNCCYEVGSDFIQNFSDYKYADKAFIKRNNKLYFDNKRFVDMQLVELGIDIDKIYNKRRMCTICCSDQCSYRRDKQNAGRQATVVSLI